MFRKVKFSIRKKVALTILVLLSFAVSLYFLFAANLFKKDKEAYIYEQGLIHGKSLAKQTTNFFARAGADMALMSALRIDEKQKELLDSIYLKNETLLSYYVFDSDGVPLFQKTKENQLSQLNIEAKDLEDSKKIKPLIGKILGEGKLVQPLKLKDGVTVFSYFVNDPVNNVILGSILDATPLINDFRESKIYESTLFDSSSTPVISSAEREFDLSNQDLKDVLNSSATSGTKKIEFTNQGVFLTTFSAIEDLGLRIIAQVELKEAFRALNFLLQMSGLFALLIICIGVISAIFGAKQLTRPVQALMEGTVAVGKGDFTTKVEVKSQDELGVLSDSFNYMGDEIMKYMEEVKEKTRMEGELEVAHLVQDSFFPKQTMISDKLEISGSYDSASECGGDWWGFSEVDGKYIVYIGDATGHGVPAALVTATTFCCVNIFENLGKKNKDLLLNPKEILELMNHAVYKMGGQILMTFFVAVIDPEKKKLTYANASHNPPFLLRAKGEDYAPTKSDIIPLMESPGYRLGHESNSTYENFEIDIESGDVISFFTDGIIEGVNPAGKEYGERRFIKSMIKHCRLSADDLLQQVISDGQSFFDGVEVDDDVTLAMVKIK